MFLGFQLGCVLGHLKVDNAVDKHHSLAMPTLTMLTLSQSTDYTTGHKVCFLRKC